MTGTTTAMAIILAVVVAAIALGALKATLRGGRLRPESFKPKQLLTPNEFEFLARLEAAAPEFRFCPQVAMGALLEPSARRGDSTSYYRQRGMFSQKIVDFVVQRRVDGVIMAIIELDDRTHDSSKDAKRDAMLSSAGYKVIRWQSKNKPDVTAIRAAFFLPQFQFEPGRREHLRAPGLTEDGDAGRIEPTLSP